uniref:Putative ovule protein n=1 Tax=Solanum chacoense TaxID=4108 RepID=A0A0V0GNL3_SOLCH
MVPSKGTCWAILAWLSNNLACFRVKMITPCLKDKDNHKHKLLVVYVDNITDDNHEGIIPLNNFSDTFKAKISITKILPKY